MTLSTLSQLQQLKQEQELQERVRQAYMQQQLNQASQGYITASTGTGNLTLSQGAGGGQTWIASQNTYQQPFQEKLDEGAWDVPISQLVDLWVVKFGTRWVNHSELDSFYRVAAQRLGKLFKLEQHHVNGEQVYRIVE